MRSHGVSKAFVTAEDGAKGAEGGGGGRAPRGRGRDRREDEVGGLGQRATCRATASRRAAERGIVAIKGGSRRVIVGRTVVGAPT